MITTSNTILTRLLSRKFLLSVFALLSATLLT